MTPNLGRNSQLTDVSRGSDSSVSERPMPYADLGEWVVRVWRRHLLELQASAMEHD